MTTEDKMFFIAKQYNQLNAKGKVKGFQGNEKGYARIMEIVRGGGLHVHHMINGQLIINLMLSEVARARYKVVCNKAVDTFNNFFKSEVNTSKWESSVKDGRMYDRYSVDVTYKDLPELLTTIDGIRNKLAVS